MAPFLFPRGIRPIANNSILLNPESDVTTLSPRRKHNNNNNNPLSTKSTLLTTSSVCRRLSVGRYKNTHNKNKKKRSSSQTTVAPEQAPLLLPAAAAAHRVFVVSCPTQRPPNPLLQWMETSCPQDVLPKILAFCGPHMTATLNQCNRFWHGVVSSDQTWRVMCEELYKWKEGQAEPQCSWREFYERNPCVPTDYASVADALAAVASLPNGKKLAFNNNNNANNEAVTIWLRPQEHRLQESLLIQTTKGVTITLETMQLQKSTLPNNNNLNNHSHNRRRRQPLASLLLQTRRRNKPLIHIAAGNVILKRLRLGHYCGGFNLWNGNAAVQIQPLPAISAAGIMPPLALPPPPSGILPTATLREVEVISHSGRGVVINDGGNVTICHSYIHDCAATGIYVGSNECHLTVEYTDLIANGHGNQLAAAVRASGVSRGHSGFYLETGHASLHQVNISNNSSCGISVSSSESRLVLDHSDVVANGHANQVEVAWGSEQHGSTNNIAKTGLVKVRSRLGLQSCCGGGASGAGQYHKRAAAGRHRRRHSSSGSTSASHYSYYDSHASTSSERHYDPVEILSDDDDDEHEDDMDHLQGSFVVAEENIRFGELIEI